MAVSLESATPAVTQHIPFNSLEAYINVNLQHGLDSKASINFSSWVTWWKVPINRRETA
jgi:hypothetical protein